VTASVFYAHALRCRIVTVVRLRRTCEEEEGLQGVFKRLRRNGHQLEKGLQMAQRGPSLK
jgi:hypothetical protein